MNDRGADGTGFAAWSRLNGSGERISERARKTVHQTNRHVRVGFDSELVVANCRVEVREPRLISPAQRAHFAEIFNRYGFCVLRCSASGDFRNELSGLRDLFGTVAPHDRADQDGITVMTPSEDYPEHLGAKSVEHPPHTDGAYDESPAKIMCLQCEVPAQVGGLSVLVSGKSLYDWLQQQDAAYPAVLSAPATMTVKRANQTATKPIFQSQSGRVQIAWRSDGTATFAPDSKTTEAVELVRGFIADSNRQLIFKLMPHEILVVDNTAVLHGRTAFEQGDPRKLNRMNFLGDGAEAEAFDFGFLPGKPAGR